MEMGRGQFCSQLCLKPLPPKKKKNNQFTWQRASPFPRAPSWSPCSCAPQQCPAPALWKKVSREQNNKICIYLAGHWTSTSNKMCLMGLLLNRRDQMGSQMESCKCDTIRSMRLQYWTGFQQHIYVPTKLSNFPLCLKDEKAEIVCI